ncbi:MAG: translocation/assembly module TamB domain-containing protein [Magnetococcales bacterium]|nr:translocation/assembly module TamB domain-containing protein [Magnetococcales bacterium]
MNTPPPDPPQTAPPRPHPFRRVWIGLAVILIAPLALLLLGGGLFVHHPGVQQALLSWLRTLPELESLHLTGISGDFRDEIRLERLEIRDPQGAWLVIEQARGRPIWASLARGVIELEEVRAERVEARRAPERLPVTPATQPTDPPAWSGWSIPIPLTLELRQARVNELHLGEPLLGALPKPLQPLLATLPAQGEVRVDLATFAVAISGIQARSDALSLAGHLEIDLQAEQLRGTFQADIPRLGAFLTPWWQTPMLGAGQVAVTLSGPPHAPRTEARLRASEWRWLDHRFTDLDTTVVIEPPASTPAHHPWPEGIRLHLTGGAGSLHLTGLPDGSPLWRPTWELTGRFEKDGQLAVEALRLAHADTLTATAVGVIDPERGGARLDWSARVSGLGEFAPLLPWPVQGQAQGEGELRMTPGGERIELHAQVRGSGIRGLPDSMAPHVGESPELGMHLTWRPDRPIEADAVRLTGHDITVSGSGRFAPEAGRIEARWQAELADLGSLFPGSDLPVAGSGTLRGLLKGEGSRLTSSFEGESKESRVGEVTLRQIAIQGEVTDPFTLPHGNLAVSARQPGGTLELSTRYRLRDAQHLELEELKASAPKSHLSGTLGMDWRQSSLTGKLKGECADLSALKPWHGLPLTGRASLDLAFDPDRQGRPAGHLNGRLTGLTGPFGRLESLKVTGRAGLTRGKPDVEAEFEVTRWQGEKLKVEALKGRASGSLSKLAFNAEGRGALGWPITFKSRGGLERVGEEQRWEIAELSGQLDKELFRLVKPVTIQMRSRDGEINRVTPWELALGDATLSGGWKREGKRVDGNLSAQGDLDLIRRLGLGAMRGKSTLAMHVSGPVERPNLEARVTVTQGRSSSASWRHLPPLDLSLSAEVNDGREPRLSWSARGLAPEEARGELVVPMRILGRAPWVELVPDGRLAGGLKAGIPLAELGKWSDPERFGRLEGVVRVDLVAGGTLNQPVVRGGAELERGHLELVESGTILHGITLNLKAEGEELLLESFTATDGDKGRLRATGRVRLDPEHHFPITLDATLEEATLVRRDDLTASMSGPLRLRGDLTGLRLSGELTVNRAEFHPGKAADEEIQVVELDEPRAGETTPTPSGSGLFPKETRLEVTALIPGRLFVRGMGLDSEWLGELKLAGTLAEPKVAGQMRVRRGHLDLLERRFQLTEGALTFDGNWPPEPWIAMEATVKRGEITTHVGLEGAARRPRVKLTSDPLLSEEEIISHLLFDRATDAITPAQALRLAVAVKTMQGGGIGLLGKLQRGLGIDRLDVGGSSLESGTVSAGKYVTDEIYLEVEKGIKADSGRINVEIEMTPQIYLKTGVDAKSNGDVGVQWKKDY